LKNLQSAWQDKEKKSYYVWLLMRESSFENSWFWMGRGKFSPSPARSWYRAWRSRRSLC
jgi:hypothetical protein